MINNWPHRIQQIRDELEPVAAQLPSLLANKELSQDEAKGAYDALDRLSEQAAVLLDEMDGTNAPEDIVTITEGLQERVEELRGTINGSHYRSTMPRRPK